MIDMVEMLGKSALEFQTAIIFTYRLDLELYDGLIRRVLNKAGVSSQVIFCALGTYLEEIRLQQSVRYIGRHYSVTPVHQAGCFHPKIYLLLGANGGRALVGSGNTTVGGLVRNAEVFGQFEFNRERDGAPHPIFKQLADFARDLAEHAPTAAQRQVQQALFSAGWLELPSVDDGRRLLIGGPGRRPLLEQILDQVPSTKIDDLIVCSSSFDRKLQGLKRLAAKTTRPPVCVVQPDRVDLDGAEVRRLADQVAWRSFVDPYPKEKRKRRDVYAHAKLFVFRHGDTETTVFGSSNASEPALMGPNTETVIVLPAAERGRTAKKLGLDPSIKSASAFGSLTGKIWPDDINDDGVTLPCILVGVSATESGFHLALVSGEPPVRSKLAVAAQSYASPIATLPLRREGRGWSSERFELIESVRFGWLVSSKDIPLSNPVAITWPEVSHARRGSSLNSKVANGLLAMRDGHMVGTILFELLDVFRDFEVIRVGIGKAPHAGPPGHAEPAAQHKPAEFFYTDARPPEVKAHHWQGDRLDLEILASLIQPLSQAAPAAIDDDEEFDESEVGEEAERRRIDSQKGKATGAERDDVPRVTSEKLEKAIGRLARRLSRAADSIEQSLEFLDRLKTVPTQAVARQIWMAQIGAFVSGRSVTSDDGDEFVCLDPKAFAEYVIRVARALVGSQRGGFLDRLPPALWETPDGELIKRGLGFLGTCVVWATARLIDEYAQADPETEWPDSLACAIPELVAARFARKLELHSIECDEHELERRFPAWAGVAPQKVAKVRLRLDRLAALIASRESHPSVSSLPTVFPSLGPGTLVYSENLGLTVLMSQATPTQFWLADLSKAGDLPAYYKLRVTPVVVDGVAPTIYCWFNRANV